MKVRPIIFNAEMVRALFAGRKTQTRRLASAPLAKCEPGDLLYVRENIWQAKKPHHLVAGKEFSDVPYMADQWDNEVLYCATDRDPMGYYWKKRPSIHMPRWASRMTLKVTKVRKQPLRMITPGDMRAEGIPVARGPRRSQKPFADLWNSLHTKPGETWEANPEVVALTYSVIHENVDSFLTREG